MNRKLFSSRARRAGAALVLVVAVLAAGRTLRGAAAEAPKDIPLSDLISEDALLYVSVPDLSALKGPFQETGLAELRRDPEVKEFLDPLLEMAKGPLMMVDGKLVETVGADSSAILRLFKGQVSIALLDLPLPGPDGKAPDSILPDVVVAAGLRESAADAPKILDRVFQLLAEAKGEKEASSRFKIGGTTAWQIALDEPDSLQAAIVQGTLIFTTKAKRLEEIVKRGGAAPPKPLGAGAGYKAAYGKTGTKNKAFFAFANLARMGELIKKNVHEEEPLKVIEKLGLFDIADVSLGATLEEKGFKEFIYLRTPKGSKGLPAWIGSLAAAKESKLVEMVPADAVAFSRANLDLRPIYEAVMEIALSAAGEEKESVEKAVGEFEKKLGRSIAKEILPSIGPDVVTWSSLPDRGLLPDGYTAIALKDRKAFEAARDRAFEMAGAEESSFDYKGGKIHTITLSLWKQMDREFGGGHRRRWDRMDMDDILEQVMPHLFMNLQFTWIDRDDAVVLCSSAMGAKRLLQRGKPEKNITANAEYQRMLGLIGGKADGAVEYYDFGPSLVGLYNTVAPFAAALDPLFKEAGVPVSFARLPLGETLADKIGRGILIMRSSPDGLQVESYSRVGTVTPVIGGAVVGGAVVAAIAVPSLLRSRVSSNEATAIAILRTLVTSEEQYKATDGAGKYTSLMGLQAAVPPFIDSVLGSGVKSGYSFVVGTETGNNFTVLATPLVRGKTGNRYFFVDSSGVIRFNVSAPANSTSVPIE